MADVDDIIRSYCDNYELHARNCLYVRDHNTSKIVPLIFNSSQKICDDIAEQQRRELGHVRIMLLKARRFGGSTWFQGRAYSKTSLAPNRNAFIVAHQTESTATLFEMAKLMHARNPLAPATLKNNEKALKFDNREGTGLKSEYRIASADTTSAGRAQGAHFVHLSEEAYYRDGDTLLKGLMQIIPDPPAYSEVVRESTANGYGNSFQVDCFAAYAEGAHPYYTARLCDVLPHMPDSKISFTFAYHSPGRSDWILIFIPWFAHDRYQLAFDSPTDRERFRARIKEKVFNSDSQEWVESYESKLQKRYGLTLEQLNWRAWAIDNKCRGRVETFREEYPAQVEEAFLSTGSNVYPKELCDQIEDSCETAIVRGDLIVRNGKTRIRRNKHGKVLLWEAPDPNEQYFLCVDSGGGRNERQKKEKRNPDPTCIDVWNYRTGAQAAQWHGHVEYDMIGDIVEMLGDLFGRATACVELQNHGYTVVADLKRKGYPMYEWKPDEPGWSTNLKTKPLMVDGLYRMARDAGMHIRCQQTVSEMRTFIEENGKYNAASGCHDERVDTAGMASQMYQLLPKDLHNDAQDGIVFSNITSRAKRPSPDYQEVYVHG
jgi:hypothetical protein